MCIDFFGEVPNMCIDFLRKFPTCTPPFLVKLSASEYQCCFPGNFLFIIFLISQPTPGYIRGLPTCSSFSGRSCLHWFWWEVPSNGMDFLNSSMCLFILLAVKPPTCACFVWGVGKFDSQMAIKCPLSCIIFLVPACFLGQQPSKWIGKCVIFLGETAPSWSIDFEVCCDDTRIDFMEQCFAVAANVVEFFLHLQKPRRWKKSKHAACAAPVHEPDTAAVFSLHGT